MAVSYKWTIKTLYTKNITDSGKTYNNVVKRVFGLLEFLLYQEQE